MKINVLLKRIYIFSKALDVHMALALLRVEGGQYTGETLDDDLRAYLNDMGHKDLSAFSRLYYT